MRKFFTILTILMAIAISSVSAKTINIPLKHTSDTQTEYVVFAYGLSSNQNIAREIAQNECYGQFARNLSSKVKSAVKTYSNNYQVSTKRKVTLDDAEVTERIITTFSNTNISRMSIVETKVEIVKVKGQKMYKYWVSMSMPKPDASDVKDAVESVIDNTNIDSVTKGIILNDRKNFEDSLADEFGC